MCGGERVCVVEAHRCVCWRLCAGAACVLFGQTSDRHPLPSITTCLLLVLLQALNKIGKPDYFIEEDVHVMQAFCMEVAVALKRKSVETALSKVTADRGNAHDRVRVVPGMRRCTLHGRSGGGRGWGLVDGLGGVCAPTPTPPPRPRPRSYIYHNHRRWTCPSWHSSPLNLSWTTRRAM